MAITVGAASYTGYGPDQTLQNVVTSGRADDLQSIRGYATLTLDGTLKTATINWIDGTKTLSFTPAVVLASVGASTLATPTDVNVSVTAVDNKGFTVYWSDAGAAADTITIVFEAFKAKGDVIPAKFFVEPYLSHGE